MNELKINQVNSDNMEEKTAPEDHSRLTPHDLDHLHGQLKYKDERIIELNNVILDKERQILDLQEQCREQGEVANVKTQAMRIVQKKFEEMESKEKKEVGTETDNIFHREESRRVAQTSLKISTPGHAVVSRGGVSPPPLDPSEADEEDLSDRNGFSGPNLDKEITLRKKQKKRVTFDLPPVSGTASDIDRAIIEEYQYKMSHLLKDNSDLKQEIDILKTSLDEEKKYFLESLTEKETLLREAKQANLKCKAVTQSRVRELEEKMAALNSELSYKIECLQNEVDTLRNSRDWELKQNGFLREEMADFRIKISKLTEELDESEKNNRSITNKLDDSQDLVDKLVLELTDAESIVVFMEDQKHSILDDVDRLKEALVAQDNLIEVLEADIVIYEEHIGILRESLGASKVDHRSIIRSRAFETKLRALELEKEQINRKSTEDRLRSKGLALKVKSLEEENEKLMERLCEAEMKMHDEGDIVEVQKSMEMMLAEERSTFSMEKNSLLSEIENLKKLLDQERENACLVQDQETAVNDLKCSNFELQATLRMVQSDSEQIVESYNSRMQILENNLIENEEKKNVLEAQIAELHSIIENHISTETSLTDRNTVLEKELESVKDELGHARVNLIETNAVKLEIEKIRLELDEERRTGQAKWEDIRRELEQDEECLQQSQSRNSSVDNHENCNSPYVEKITSLEQELSQLRSVVKGFEENQHSVEQHAIETRKREEKISKLKQESAQLRAIVKSFEENQCSVEQYQRAVNLEYEEKISTLEQESAQLRAIVKSFEENQCSVEQYQRSANLEKDEKISTLEQELAQLRVTLKSFENQQRSVEQHQTSGNYENEDKILFLEQELAQSKSVIQNFQENQIAVGEFLASDKIEKEQKIASLQKELSQLRILVQNFEENQIAMGQYHASESFAKEEKMRSLEQELIRLQTVIQNFEANQKNVEHYQSTPADVKIENDAQSTDNVVSNWNAPAVPFVEDNVSMVQQQELYTSTGAPDHFQAAAEETNQQRSSGTHHEHHDSHGHHDNHDHHDSHGHHGNHEHHDSHGHHDNHDHHDHHGYHGDHVHSAHTSNEYYNNTETEQVDRIVSENIILRKCVDESVRTQEDIYQDLEKLCELKCELETAVEALKGEIWSLNAQLRKTLCEYENLEDRMDVVQNDLDTEKSKVADLANELSQQKASTENTEFKLTESVKECSALKVELAELIDSREQLQDAYTQLNGYYEQLQAAYNELYIANNLETLSLDNKPNGDEISNIMDNIISILDINCPEDNVIGKLKTISETITALKQEMDSLNEMVQEQEKLNDELSSKLDDANKAVLNNEKDAALREKLCEMEQHLVDKSVSDSLVERLRTEIEILAAKLTTKQADVDSLFRTNAELAYTNVNLQNQIDDLKESNDQMAPVVGNSESVKIDDTKKTQIEVVSALQVIRSAHAALFEKPEATLELNDLEKHSYLEVLGLEIKRFIDTSSAHIDNLLSENSVLAIQNRNLQAKQEVSPVDSNELNSLNACLEDLKEQNVHLTNQLSEMQEQYQNTLLNTDALNKQLDDTRIQNALLHESERRFMDSVNELNKQLKELPALKKNLNIMRTENEELKLSLVTLTNQLNEIKQTTNQVESPEEKNCNLRESFDTNDVNVLDRNNSNVTQNKEHSLRVQPEVIEVEKQNDEAELFEKAEQDKKAQQKSELQQKRKERITQQKKKQEEKMLHDKQRLEEQHEQERLEEKRNLEDKQKVEEAQKQKELQRLENKRRLEEKQKVEKAQKLKELQRLEEMCKLEEKQKLEEAQRQKELQRLEDEHRLEEKQKLEEAQKQEELQRLEDKRRLEVMQKVEEARKLKKLQLEEQQKVEEARKLEEMVKLEERRMFEAINRVKDLRMIDPSFDLEAQKKLEDKMRREGQRRIESLHRLAELKRIEKQQKLDGKQSLEKQRLEKEVLERERENKLQIQIQLQLNELKQTEEVKKLEEDFRKRELQKKKEEALRLAQQILLKDKQKELEAQKQKKLKRKQEKLDEQKKLEEQKIWEQNVVQQNSQEAQQDQPQSSWATNESSYSHNSVGLSLTSWGDIPLLSDNELCRKRMEGSNKK